MLKRRVRILAARVKLFTMNGVGTMKLRSLAVTIVAACALTGLAGIPPASAQTGWTLCTFPSGTAYCLVPSSHGYPAELSAVGAGPITFTNRYVTPNGNAWWELKSLYTGLCLNWAPQDGNLAYWDSCVPGDGYELFYNHVAGQLINLAGNEIDRQNTYLRPTLCSGLLCGLTVSTTRYTGWVERLPT